MEQIKQWFEHNMDILFAAFACAFVYFLLSEEQPRKKKLSSTIAGLIMAIVFAPAISEWLHVVEYDYIIGAILAVSGRWAVDMVRSIAKKFTKNKFGV